MGSNTKVQSYRCSFPSNLQPWYSVDTSRTPSTCARVQGTRESEISSVAMPHFQLDCITLCWRRRTFSSPVLVPSRDLLFLARWKVISAAPLAGWWNVDKKPALSTGLPVLTIGFRPRKLDLGQQSHDLADWLFHPHTIHPYFGSILVCHAIFFTST